uniref:ATP-grasp domain-containing protein n=1 Tax=Methanococcus maripaludis (strain C6 / ATCC BAA-1332) TaxID=444158 RepID=A9A8Q6_METM6
MKALVVGVNTRPVVNSLKKLNFEVYSVSHYNPVDLNADHKKYLVNDKFHGHFVDKYSEKELLSLSKEYVDLVDYIFICSGVFESKYSKTPNWNVVGNSPKRIKNISDKYRTVKRLENLGFNVPITYLVNNKYQFEKCLTELKSVVVKPILGSGGIGVTNIDFQNTDNLDIKYPVLVQEYIKSESYSASFIGSNFLCFNKQLINNNIYVGNISPYVPKVKNETIRDFKELMDSLDLLGMNGIDFMLKDGIPYIIEVNPRILGTYEVIELSSKYNLSKAILENKSVRPKDCFFKKIVFSNKGSSYFIDKNPLIRDIPQKGAYIEEGEPVATIIGRNMADVRETESGILRGV